MVDKYKYWWDFAQAVSAVTVLEAEAVMELVNEFQRKPYLMSKKKTKKQIGYLARHFLKYGKEESNAKGEGVKTIL
jgi:hypothetical protein